MPQPNDKYITRMSQPQFDAAYRLALEFGHWWADRLNRYLTDKNVPSSPEDAWRAYDKNPTLHTTLCEIARTTRDTVGIQIPIPTDTGEVRHITQHATLSWRIRRNGWVHIEARPQSSPSYPIGPVWWDATIAPASFITDAPVRNPSRVHLTSTIHAPIPDTPDWAGPGGDGAGNYAWRKLGDAFTALGAECPPPPAPNGILGVPRRFNSGRRTIASIA